MTPITKELQAAVLAAHKRVAGADVVLDAETFNYDARLCCASIPALVARIEELEAGRHEAEPVKIGPISPAERKRIWDMLHTAGQYDPGRQADYAKALLGYEALVVDTAEKLSELTEDLL